MQQICTCLIEISYNISARHAKPVNYSTHWHRWHCRMGEKPIKAVLFETTLMQKWLANHSGLLVVHVSQEAANDKRELEPQCIESQTWYLEALVMRCHAMRLLKKGFSTIRLLRSKKAYDRSILRSSPPLESSPSSWAAKKLPGNKHASSQACLCFSTST